MKNSGASSSKLHEIVRFIFEHEKNRFNTTHTLIDPFERNLQRVLYFYFENYVPLVIFSEYNSPILLSKRSHAKIVQK